MRAKERNLTGMKRKKRGSGRLTLEEKRKNSRNEKILRCGDREKESCVVMETGKDLKTKNKNGNWFTPRESD